MPDRTDTGLITVREACFRLFRAFGMTTVFGNPGSTELPMFREFPDDFRYVLGLQESVVIGMADGYAQARRNAALINLHSAAGVGHGLGNLFTAFRNQTPLVITAGQQARSILPYEPFLFAQDATEFPKPYVKWACEPARAEDVPAALARAYYMAMQAPQGPTFVSVPVDDWDRLCDPLEPRIASRIVVGDPALLADAAAQLNRSAHPVFVVGAGVARDRAWSDVIALAEKHQASVWVSPLSARNSFPEDHRLFAGFLPASRAAISATLADHDLIVVFGAPVFTYHVESGGTFVPEGARLVQMVDDPSMAARSPVGLSIVTDLRSGLRALLEATAPVSRNAPAPMTRPPFLSGDRLDDNYLMQQIAALKPPGTIIVEEAPSSRTPMHDYLPITEEDGFYTCASGGLGHGLPASVGVALGRPGERVIALLGDGSSMYSIQGLWSAAQLKLPITFIIVNNGAYKALDSFVETFNMKAPVGTKLPEIEFCGLAQSMGVRASRVEGSQALDPVLKDAFAADGPVLVEVVIQ